MCIRDSVCTPPEVVYGGVTAVGMHKRRLSRFYKTVYRTYALRGRCNHVAARIGLFTCRNRIQTNAKFMTKKGEFHKTMASDFRISK